MQTQTRRHSFIVSLLGIKHVIVAINKMDLIDHGQDRFDSIVADYRAFANKLGLGHVHCLPVVALTGDNVLERSSRLAWYDGPTLVELLESVPVGDESASADFRFPVQYVNRHSASFRGFAGTVASGRIAVGDGVMVMPSGRQSRIDRIVCFDGDQPSARAGQAVTFTLADEIDVSRGDMLVRPDARPRIAEGLDARLVWMADTPLNAGRQYDLRFATASVAATPELIHHQIDVNSLEHHHVDQLGLNDIGLVRWRLGKATAFDAYNEHRQTGAFTVIDRISNLTVGAGMIVRPVTDTLADKSANVVWHEHRIAKIQRAGQKSQRPAVLWFTGLSGAGKSSVANALEQALFQRGHHSYLLDGDNVRHGLNRDLGFTDEDRVENIRRIGEVARLMADAGLVVLSAFISPFRADRELVRELMEPGEFVEIYVHASLETCESRDPKGLYAKARAGAIKHFTGIDSPYEAPEKAEVVLDTEKLSIEESVDELIEYLRQRQILI